MKSNDDNERKRAARLGIECPYCRERSGIEWNGIGGARCAYACNGAQGCSEQWDAHDYGVGEDA
jgi:sarcosine oxidase delta subunit